MEKISPAKMRRMQKYRYRLTGSVCSKCQKKYYPCIKYCPICHEDRYVKQIELQPDGRILSWSGIYAAPAGFEKNIPYIIALIKLKDGPVVLSQICDCEENKIKMGLKVKSVFRRLINPDESGVIKYGIKFEPEWSK